MKKIKRFCWNCKTEVPSLIYSDITTTPVCPCCGVFYPEKPKLEALLSLKQDKYLKTRNEEDLASLFKDLPELTFNLICHRLSGIQKNLDPEEIWDKTYWTIEKLVSYYKTKPNFRIDGSFSGYISQMILYPLHNKKDAEMLQKEVSMDSPIDHTDKNSKTLEEFINAHTKNFDYSSDIEKELIIEEKKQKICSNISDYIISISNQLYEENKVTFLEMYQLIKLFELFSKKRNEKYFEEAFKTSSPKMQDIWEYMLDELSKKLKEWNSDNYEY